MRKIRNPVIYIALIVAAYLYLLTGCGNYEPPEFPPIDYYLVITDSIGIEEGDSNYVFYLPAGVALSTNGDIAVLDKLKHAAFVYNPDGEFIQMVGREGEGPGEFHMPGGIEYGSDGSLMIIDTDKIAIFDSTYQFLSQMTWPQMTPHPIRAFEYGYFVGTQWTFKAEEQEILWINTLARWEGVEDPAIEYFSTEHYMTPDNASDFSTSRGFEILACATYEGRVFYSQSSIDRFEIFGCEPDGTPFFHVEDVEYRKIRKTDEELQFELDRFAGYANRVTGGQIRSVNVELDPYKRSILNMFTDGEDRLWVRLGCYPGIVFRIYDMTGESQFHVMFDYPGDPADLINWQVTGSEQGFLAYETMPEYYPRIYILSLVEAE